MRYHKPRHRDESKVNWIDMFINFWTTVLVLALLFGAGLLIRNYG